MAKPRPLTKKTLAEIHRIYRRLGDPWQCQGAARENLAEVIIDNYPAIYEILKAHLGISKPDKYLTK